MHAQAFPSTLLLYKSSVQSSVSTCSFPRWRRWLAEPYSPTKAGEFKHHHLQWLWRSLCSDFLWRLCRPAIHLCICLSTGWQSHSCRDILHPSDLPDCLWWPSQVVVCPSALSVNLISLLNSCDMLHLSLTLDICRWMAHYTGLRKQFYWGHRLPCMGLCSIGRSWRSGTAVIVHGDIIRQSSLEVSFQHCTGALWRSVKPYNRFKSEIKLWAHATDHVSLPYCKK